MDTNRRDFLKKSAVATTGVAILPNILTAGCSTNEKITVGLIGCYGMGMQDLKAFLQIKNVECAALCDIDERVLNMRAAEVEKIQGKKPKLYSDFRKLLEQKDIDTVIVGTPDHWHCLPVVYACQEGKDVYTEKPLANSIEECNVMEKAVKRYRNVVQVGQWQRSDPHWLDAVKYIHAGEIGRVRSVHAWSYVGWADTIPVVPDSPVPDGVDYDMWLGPAPKRPFNKNRFHFNFRWFWDYAGGLMTDWGVHLLDYALFGMDQYVPKSVCANGGKYAFPNDAMETPDTMMAMFDFGDFGLMWDHSIGITGARFNKRGHGVAFTGEYGTLIVDRNGWEVVPERSFTSEYELGDSKREGYKGMPHQKSTGKGLFLHAQNFIDCVKTREKPNCDIEIGAHIARVSQLGNISYRLGRKLEWDGEKQEFVNDREANTYVKANYRAPWTLPQI